MQISHDDGYGRTDVFTVVDGFPNSTYFVWNIGDNMTDGYLPLCQRDPYQEDWQMKVRLNTLCAIDMRDDPELLAKFRQAARWGISNYETALAASQKSPFCQNRAVVLTAIVRSLCARSRQWLKTF